MVPDPGHPICVSRLHPQIRLVFNLLRKTQEKLLRYSSHFEYLRMSKSLNLIPKGLSIEAHINTADSYCSGLVNQALAGASSRLLDILIMDSLNAVQLHTATFIYVCRILNSAVDFNLFSAIIFKLRQMGLRLQTALVSQKRRKLCSSMQHANSSAHGLRSTCPDTLPDSTPSNFNHIPVNYMHSQGGTQPTCTRSTQDAARMHRLFSDVQNALLSDTRHSSQGSALDVSSSQDPPLDVSVSQGPAHDVSLQGPAHDASTSHSSNPGRPTPAPTRSRRRRWVKRSKYRRQNRRRITPITNSKCVVNLSTHTLSEHETSVLTRGLKFCPTRPSVDDLELRTDLDKFARRLRLKVHFLKEDEDDANDFTPDGSLLNHPLLKRESFYTPPPGQDPFLDAYITSVQTDIIHGIKPKTYRNISREEHKALNDIKNNRSIVVKEADKGSAVVIQDRDDYVHECMRQLNNTTHFKRLTKILLLCSAKTHVVVLTKLWR